MKQPTFQEQYNLIQEGKGNKGIFLKAVKKAYPSLVRNAAGFNEASTILKKRGIISEHTMNLGVTTIKPHTNWFDVFNKNMEALQEEAKAIEKKPTNDVVDLETKGYDYKDKDNLDNVGGWLVGYYVEIKNPKNADKTVEEVKSIVSKNLAKDPLYYVKGGQFGVDGLGYTEDVPGLAPSKTDQMEKVKVQESKESLKEYTDYSFSGRDTLMKLREPDYDAFRDFFPTGVASNDEAEDTLVAHDQNPIKMRMGRYAPMFVHVQYHDFTDEAGEKYRVHQTQYYNSNFEDKDPNFNPRVTVLSLKKLADPDNPSPQSQEDIDLGEMAVKTDAYIKDLRNLKNQGQLGDRISESSTSSLLDLIGESYDEFQRDGKGAKDVAAKDKGEEDAYGAGVKKGEEMEKVKVQESIKASILGYKLKK